MKNNNIIITSLAVSVILNSFLLGLVISPKAPFGPHMMNRGGPSGAMMPPPHEFRLEKAAKALPEEYKSKVEEIIKKNHEEASHHMGNIHATFDEIDKVLTADKFDEEKFKSIISKIDESDKVMKSGMLEMTLTIAKNLPDKERIEFFSQLSDKKGRLDRPDNKNRHESFDRHFRKDDNFRK